MSLRDRVDSWHAILAAVFLFGAVVSLLQASTVDGFAALNAAANGLLWAFLFHIVAGTLRNYVAEYAGTGGSLTAPRFLAPFVVGAVAAAAVLGALLAEEAFSLTLVATALWVGFWAFVIAMGVVLVATYVAAGYREAMQ